MSIYTKEKVKRGSISTKSGTCIESLAERQTSKVREIQREEVIDGGTKLERFRISNTRNTEINVFLLVRYVLSDSSKRRTERASQPQGPINEKPTPTEVIQF